MRNHGADPLIKALREPAAMLDAQGRVVAANGPFSGFELDGALAGPRFSPGTTYLQAADARHAALAQGLREVLAGRSASFTYVYECGTPARSFELVVAAHGDPEGGALVVQYDITDRKRLEQARREADDRLQYISDLMPDGYWDWDIPTGECFLSPRWCESLGYTHAEVPQRIESWLNLVHPEDMARVQAALETYWERKTGIYQIEYRPRQKDGTYRWSLDQGRVVRWSEDGKPLRMVGVDINIHERKVAELTIREQAQRIMEMSTPLIPITDDVVVMPLIGVIDSNRAQQILTSVLEGISHRRAKVAILDVTGVGEMDTQTASMLINVARAVQLLGARAVLTGIRPEIATILVRLEIDWGNIVVRSTLQSGIAYATGSERR